MNAAWQAYGKAHQLIFRHGYWKYLSIPILLSVLVATLMLAGGYFLAAYTLDRLTQSFPALASQPGWARTLGFLLLLILQAGPFYVVFRGLVMVCYGPFLDRLSERVEIQITQKSSGANIGMLRSCIRPLVLAAYTIAASLALFLASIGLGLIPVLGWIISILLIWPLQLFLSSVSYVDPYLERQGVSPLAAFRKMWGHKSAMVCFGGIAALISLIPVIGWFLGPTYSVVAGLVFSAEHLSNKHLPETIMTP